MSMRTLTTKIKPFLIIKAKTGRVFSFNKVQDCVNFLRASGHPKARRTTVYALIRGTVYSCYGYVIDRVQYKDDAIIALPYKERVKYEAHELILRIETDLKSLKSLLKSQ